MLSIKQPGLLTIIILLLLIGCSITSEPVAPTWDEQLQYATRVAHDVAPDATPLYVTANARYTGWYGEEDMIPVMNYSWFFVSPATGKHIEVEYEDTAMAKTLETYVNDIKGAPPLPLLTPAEQEQYNNAISFVQISPLQAYQIATQGGLFFNDKRSFVAVGLMYAPSVQEKLHIPAVWRALFMTRTVSGQHEHHMVWINANTGEIVGQTDDLPPGVVPTAQPATPITATVTITP